ncbi:hypothetical protein AB1Y20_013098 [Prymnesium parvum]|uniref:Uncharacterized protein n=1 Tax=Prymnesium parvum TaxID=97485 RepID=A0AB34INB3_PRYPA
MTLPPSPRPPSLHAHYASRPLHKDEPSIDSVLSRGEKARILLLSASSAATVESETAALTGRAARHPSDQLRPKSAGKGARVGRETAQAGAAAQRVKRPPPPPPPSDGLIAEEIYKARYGPRASNFLEPQLRPGRTKQACVSPHHASPPPVRHPTPRRSLQDANSRDKPLSSPSRHSPTRLAAKSAVGTGNLSRSSTAKSASLTSSATTKLRVDAERSPVKRSAQSRFCACGSVCVAAAHLLRFERCLPSTASHRHAPHREAPMNSLR